MFFHVNNTVLIRDYSSQLGVMPVRLFANQTCRIIVAHYKQPREISMQIAGARGTPRCEFFRIFPVIVAIDLWR